MMNTATILFIVFAVAITVLVACRVKKPGPNNTVTFTAVLTGANETPPVVTDAMGAATLVYDNCAKKFVLTVDYEGLVPISAHIHKGGVGVAGPIVFPIDVTVTPLRLTSRVLTAEEEADLKAGLYYVNLHTTAYPAGEIRGQFNN